MFFCWDIGSDMNNSKFVFSFQNGWSALMLASRYGRTEIVKYLIEAKASLDLQMQVYVHKILMIMMMIMMIYCTSNFDDGYLLYIGLYVLKNDLLLR